ncbi:MAG: cupin domain-containing protein, partial [Methyloligellaceae bacterium]
MKASKPKFIRLEPNGPNGAGLAEWDPIDPAGLESGTPVQRGHIYHEDETHGYLAGVWDCTPMSEKFGPYTVHEFMFLLEGSVIMVAADGSETTVRAGESFIIPKGLPCQWKQTEYVRKYFMIFEDPDAQPGGDVASQGVIVP